MKTMCGVLLLLSVACELFAQQPEGRPPGKVARSPVILTDSIQPNIPDPSGVYSGIVDGQVFSRVPGRNGFFKLGGFTITIATDACEDCEQGQFRVFAANGFSGMENDPDSHPDQHELGGFSAYINPRGGMISVGVLLGNCDTVNPNGQNLSPLGEPCCYIPDYFQAGHDGEFPGNTLAIVGDQIRGRISGRNCFSEAVYADVVLTKSSR